MENTENKSGFHVSKSLTSDLEKLKQTYGEEKFIEIMKYNTADIGSPENSQDANFEKAVDYTLRSRFISVPLIMSRAGVDKKTANEFLQRMINKSIIEENGSAGIHEAIITREHWRGF
jgi:hypothetical protein